MRYRAPRQILLAISLLFLLTVGGAVGFRTVTDSDWVESFYMAVITVTTVGYRDPEGLTSTGKIFVICYLFVGLGTFTYSLSLLGQWVISENVRRIIERRRMEKSIHRLKDHYIVCGMGRMGLTICEYLAQKGRPFVVIDNDDDRLAEICGPRNWHFIGGDATDDAVLLQAGIHEARSLATVLPTDADNVYVVLSSNMLAPQLQIIARASDEKAIEKMEHAGASRVISPFSSGAVKMARFMLNPTVEDFLEIADSQGTELELADVQITAGSPYIGKKLMETDMRSKGVMIIGIRRANGERLMPPSGGAIIQPGDSLFAFGSTTAVQAMIAESELDR